MSTIPNPKPPAFTLTPEAKELLTHIKEVEASAGRDARKARLLAIHARALLEKMAQISPPIHFLLYGKPKGR